MSATITSNNKYFNLFAKSLNLDGVDVGNDLVNLQNEIDAISQATQNAWDNTNSGSVPISTGYFLTTDGIINGAVANGNVQLSYTDQNRQETLTIYNPNAPNLISIGVDDNGVGEINCTNKNIECISNFQISHGYNLVLSNLNQANEVNIKLDTSTDNLIINNGVHSQTNFTGASAYNFNGGSIYSNGVPIGGTVDLQKYEESLSVPPVSTFITPPCNIDNTGSFTSTNDIVASNGNLNISLTDINRKLNDVISLLYNLTNIQIS
jgi:hypothetical protein